MDFRRNLTLETNIVRTMTAALANRGPDGESIVASGNAVLGCRRLFRSSGDHWPEAASWSRPDRNPGPVILVLDGVVYNTAALRAELTGRGHRFTSGSEVEVIKSAYAEWGRGCVERLEGLFAFALWDDREHRLVLARDHVGAKPMYYAETAQGALFGSEPKALLAHPAMDAVVDADGLAELFGFCGTPGHAVYRGMRQVLPGHLVTISRSGLHETEYWTLPPRPHTDDWYTTVDTVQELLRHSVKRQLRDEGPLCTLLSGGIDSSVVAALVKQELGPESAPHTFAVDFAGHQHRFAADNWHKDTDAPFADEVAAYVGTEHTRVVLHTDELVDPVARSTAVRSQDLPRQLGDMDRSFYLLLRSVRQHAGAAVCGEGADEMFGGYSWYHDRSLREADTFPWVALAQRYAAPQGLGTGLIDRELLAEIDVPGYCRDRYAEALAAVPVLPGEGEEERRMRAAEYVQLTRWMPMLLARDDRLSMAHGLQLRLPYCDRSLLEYVFNIPWSMKTADGREKSVLRSAATGLVPDSVLRREKSPFPTTQDPYYGEVLRREFLDVVSDPGSAVAPLLDRRATKELLDRGEAVSVDGWKHRNNVDMIIQLDMWLREYGVRLAL